MKTPLVDIDFPRLAIEVKKAVRTKAANAHSTIIYKQGYQLIEENPRTSLRRIVKEYTHS